MLIFIFHFILSILIIMQWILGQLGFGDSNNLITYLIQLIYLVFFVLWFFLFTPLQVTMYLHRARDGLRSLERLLAKGKNIVVETARSYGCPESQLANIDTILDFFTINPVSIDPSGLIRRLEHLITVSKRKLEQISLKLVPKASIDERANFVNTLTTAIVLNIIYKYARHLYMLGKKMKNPAILMQLDILLPQLRELATAYYNSFSASLQGAPIGDGVGPLVALHLIGKNDVKVISEDMVMSSFDYKGRKVIVVKAAGPGGRVGKPGDAIARIIDDAQGKIDLVIMIDAALKMEGEKSGSLAEGIGAAIGDPGPEKYKIEEITTRYEIPLHAIVIKESIKEALSPMTKDIAMAAVKTVERIKSIILEDVPEGGTVVIAGIGNTMGIGNRVGADE